MIRLKDRTSAESEVVGVQLRIDPGSKGTGLVLTDEKKETGDRGAIVTVRRGLIAIELEHRGDQIRACVRQRAGYRRRRRSTNLRYRAPRSKNRTHPQGWLPPSLRHRIDTTFTLADRLCRYAPVTENTWNASPSTLNPWMRADRSRELSVSKVPWPEPPFAPICEPSGTAPAHIAVPRVRP
jgi:hypothetical protein